MLVKLRQPDETLPRRGPHARHTLKPHLIGNQRQNLLAILVRKTQPLTDTFGHPNSHIYMTVKADPISRLRNRPECARFSYIMQKNTPSKRRRTSRRKSF